MSQVFTLTHYKGGQGASVAAAVLAHTLRNHARVLLVSDTHDALGALGIASPLDDFTPDISLDSRLQPLDFLRVGDTDTSEPIASQYTRALLAAEVPTLAVVDLPPALLPALDDFHRHTQKVRDVTRVVVCRGDYLSLRSTSAAITGLPGGHGAEVLTFDEPDRALTARDVEVVLRVEGRAMVAPWSPAFARVIDAGMLPYRLDMMPEALRYLDALAPLIRSAREWLHALTV